MIDYTSLDAFIASHQLESDYKNLVAFYDDYNVFGKTTKQHQSAKVTCEKLLESIIKQKRILEINFDEDIKLLTKLKFEI